jgi:hypothetical protein
MDEELLEWIRQEIRGIFYEEKVQNLLVDDREKEQIPQKVPKPLRKFKYGEELPNHFDETLYLQVQEKNKEKGKTQTIKQKNRHKRKK